MLRMRTKLSVLAAAVVAAVAGVNSAEAGIQITGQVVPIQNVAPVTGFSETQAYVANGFVGVIISANVTSGSASIAGWDMTTDTGIAAHGQLGISNALGFAQAFFPPPGGRGSPVPTPTGGGYPFADNHLPTGSTDAVDSWFSPLSAFNINYASGGAPLEDSNNSSAGAPNGVPINPTTNDSFYVYGMGTFLRESLTISNDTANGKPQPSSVPIAYVIVKQGSVINVNTRIFDNNNTDFFLSTNIQAGTIPEPASVGVLAMGALALMARRRKA